MELEKIIVDVFGQSPYGLQPLQKGFTNKNYRLCIQGSIYIVRVPWKDSEHIVNHEHEEKVIKAIQDLQLDVPLIYFDAKCGIKITKYIDQLKEFQECKDRDAIIRTAKLMKRLHHAKKCIQIEFDPLDRYFTYRKHVRHPLYDVSLYEDIIQVIKGLSSEHVLCHNDWVSGNILLGKERDYLIDYEYGADNDPLFDVMSFITENNIDDPHDREIFFEEYFDEWNDECKERLYIWEVFHNLLWCMWAMMMWEQRKESIYKRIANDKYIALQTCGKHKISL